MTLKDLTLPIEEIDWRSVLQHWSWLLQDHPEFSVWILTRFADLFVRLPDDSIWELETGSATFQRVADSKHHFAEIVDRSDRLKFWFMPSLIEELEAEGQVLGEKQCYGFKIPPGFKEGNIVSSNIKVVEIEEYFIAMGDLWGKLRDVPDGATVKFKITE